RSEEHTSELQSLTNLVCRLLLEKKRNLTHKNRGQYDDNQKKGASWVWAGWPETEDLILFFFNDTATTEIYTLSLHDALPICARARDRAGFGVRPGGRHRADRSRSEEHTSELQSLTNLVCRLLLEKKKKN